MFIWAAEDAPAAPGFSSPRSRQMIFRPRSILLATDLSARSDRALDRAAVLKAHFGAKLVVLHVLEPRETPSSSALSFSWPPAEAQGPNHELVAIAGRQLRADLRDAGEGVEVRVEEGHPAGVILRVADEEGCDLIVTGVARNETLGRFSLGKTVDEVLRSANRPVLIVTDRARAPYNNVVVAVDLSRSSRQALETAAALFHGQRLTVLHVFDVPYLSFGRDATAIAETAREARESLVAFVKEAGLEDESRSSLDLIVAHGDPEQALNQLARQERVELVVLGSGGRGPVLNRLLGSVAPRIVAGLPCDALVVRAGASGT
jgi:nucleotide-binding universal stress UspA family protein